MIYYTASTCGRSNAAPGIYPEHHAFLLENMQFEI